MVTLMKIENISYSVGALTCEGVLVYYQAAKNPPLLLMAPNWMGVTEKAIEGAKHLAALGYVVFLADMFGVAGRPTGQEVPMEFLGPLIRRPLETRARINAAFEAMTQAALERGWATPPAAPPSAIASGAPMSSTSPDPARMWRRWSACMAISRPACPPSRAP
jgi:hypothetical protein